MSEPPSRGSLYLYSLVLLSGVGLFLLIRCFGEEVPRPVAAVVASARAHTTEPFPLFRLLATLVVTILTARVLGHLFGRLGQPRVIGEVVAGIVLGPSLLGRVSPDALAFLFPEAVMPVLSAIAQLGVILYMFLIGLELNPELLRSRIQATVAISHTSILVPLVLGALLALGIYVPYAPAGVSFTSFALFMGVAMAITAFPVLARILTDLGIERTELGIIALGCAAVDDVTAWCLLALVIGVHQADVSAGLLAGFLAACYILLMMGVARPWIARRLQSTGKRSSRDVTAWILAAVLFSALVTEAIGIHAIFGAFLLGAIIPHDSEIASTFRHKLEEVVSVLLLPVFFAIAGTRTEIGLLSEPSDWLVCAIVVATATAGKFGGTLIAARWTRLNWRTSASLGVLMNTRGLMELIVLNIGLDLGVISPRLFAMMVIMAVATTMATAPVLQWLRSNEAKSPPAPPPRFT